MKQTVATALALAFFTTPVVAGGHATGDAEAGEKAFKKCKACHAIINPDMPDEPIFKGGKTGPNLYGIFGRQAGAEEVYAERYGKSLVAAGEAGLVWNEADFMGYVADPRGFLKAYLDDSGAKSKMTYKLKKEDDQRDVWAYLVSVGPEVEEDAEATSTATD